MQTFTEMPYGYRWFTNDERDEYFLADSHDVGWMRPEYVGVVVPHADSIVAGYIRQWNCMIEFGLDHVHDAYECENTMYLMNANSEYDYYAEAYNRELEEDMLGRPLFPNEY